MKTSKKSRKKKKISKKSAPAAGHGTPSPPRMDALLPLTEGTEGQWVGDCAEATPVLVPLLSLGRRVVATPVAGEPAGGRC